MTRKAVIFDVGRVLIEWDMRRVFRRVLPDEAAIDAFLAETGWHHWNRELDRGLRWGGEWDTAVAALAARFPHWRAPIEAAHHRWHEAVPGAIEGSVEILEALHRAGTPLYAITNFSREKWRETRARFPFLATHFRDAVVSAEHGLLKPEPESYRLCLARNGLSAGSCVFIDDTAENVAAARALGMDAIRFEGPAQIRRELARRGLSPDLL
jgi:2-haloacid dehalogenase